MLLRNGNREGGLGGVAATRPSSVVRRACEPVGTTTSSLEGRRGELSKVAGWRVARIS